jgi:hypothetical protein
MVAGSMRSCKTRSDLVNSDIGLATEVSVRMCLDQEKTVNYKGNSVEMPTSEMSIGKVP